MEALLLLSNTSECDAGCGWSTQWQRAFKEGFRNIDAKKVSVDKEDAGNMKMLKVKVASGENVKPGT